MEHITELLIAAMERHLSWSAPSTVTWKTLDGGTASLTVYQFELDEDINGAPALYVPEEGEEIQLLGTSPVLLDGFDGTIQAGSYSIDKPNEGWMPPEIGSCSPIRFRADSELLELLDLDGTEYRTVRDGVIELLREEHVLLVILSEFPTYRYRMTFLDLLALIAAADARTDGRHEDAQMLADSVPLLEVFSLDNQSGMLGSGLFEGDCTVQTNTPAFVPIFERIEQLAAAVTTPEIPPLTAIRPIRHYVPVSKENHYLTDPDAFLQGGLMLDVGRRKGQTYIEFALTAPDDALRTADGKPLTLDHTDREIISAVASLREAAKKQTGEPVVNAYNILEEMGVEHPEPKRCSDVDARIRKMMSVGTYIDYTEEARRRGKKHPVTGNEISSEAGSFVIRGNLIPATVIEVTDSEGITTVRYRLIDDPPTYKHAADVGQVVTHPSRLLKIAPIKKDGTEVRKASTERQIGIKSYLLERIYVLKNKKSSISGTILYATLCDKVGVDPRNRSTKKRVVDYAENYLRALQAEGVIVDFRPTEEGKSHNKVSVEIFVKRA